MIQVPGKLDQRISPCKGELFPGTGSRKDKSKNDTDLKLIANRFVLPTETTEKFSTKESPKQEDAQMFSSMFIIGKKNIFKLRKLRKVKSSSSTNQSEEDMFWKNEILVNSETKPKGSLRHFQAETQIKILRNNSEEGIIYIKQLDILQMKKTDLKKCKRCNFKKRHCALDQFACNATNKCCFLCKKVGHFPQSLCCRKRRKAQCKPNQKFKNNGNVRNPEKISKRNLKLIKKKIKQLELNNTRKSLLELAERCAQKFASQKCEIKTKSFTSYCNKKLHGLLKNHPLPDAEENVVIQNVLKVYDQMFYNRVDSGDENLRQENTEKVNPDVDKFFGNEDTMIPQLDGLDDNLTDDERQHKGLFAVNCEEAGIIQLMNFFRGFNLLWEKVPKHKICNFNQNCFYCHM